jgi:hypothetical protein
MRLARRTVRGAAWAVLAGVLAARFFEPSLGEAASIAIGVAAAVAVDVWYRRRQWQQEERQRRLDGEATQAQQREDGRPR